MANFGRPRVLGRIILLIAIILALVVGGIVWFDFIGLIDAKSLLAPAYRLIGIRVRTESPVRADHPNLLEEERYAKRLESLKVRSEELDTRSAELEKLNSSLVQRSQELDDRTKAIEDKEKSFNERVKQYENKRANIEQNAEYLTSMDPNKAVGSCRPWKTRSSSISSGPSRRRRRPRERHPWSPSGFPDAARAFGRHPEEDGPQAERNRLARLEKAERNRLARLEKAERNRVARLEKADSFRINGQPEEGPDSRGVLIRAKESAYASIGLFFESRGPGARSDAFSGWSIVDSRQAAKKGCKLRYAVLRRPAFKATRIVRDGEIGLVLGHGSYS
jgi:flagellar protein FlbB